MSMRKTSTITINDGGQDKKFAITQMPATQAERFRNKLVFLLGGNLDALSDAGRLFASLAAQDYDKVQELLDMLLAGCSILNGKVETKLTPENVDGFIDEISTLDTLRMESFKANSFFPRKEPSGSEKSPEATIKRRG